MLDTTKTEYGVLAYWNDSCDDKPAIALLAADTNKG